MGNSLRSAEQFALIAHLREVIAFMQAERRAADMHDEPERYALVSRLEVEAIQLERIMTEY
jgi:hypothetical protein